MDLKKITYAHQCLINPIQADGVVYDPRIGHHGKVLFLSFPNVFSDR